MDPEVNFRRTSTLVTEDDLESSECSDRNRDCCPPQLFTSILLGLLACVLVTGGVFLAFHKWDHTWLLVSAVGVLLMAIGTALHCCSSQQNQKNHRCKSGCGGARSKPDSVGNGTGAILTEQLLPLSNARSVSQLSLNMVPGYFPPLVFPTGSPYGLEQHSAVVQNISKLVQHQQQLHLQSPTATQSDSKSFILLPLPVDANATNIQNIVAAVCQLDTNNSDSNNEAQTTDVSSQATETSVLSRENAVPCMSSAPQPSTVAQPVLKNAEVQTCNDWRPTNELKQSSAVNVPDVQPAIVESSTSQTAEVAPLQRIQVAEAAVSTVEESVQREETVLEIEPVSDTNCDNTNLLLNDIPTQPDIPANVPSTEEPQESAETGTTSIHSNVTVPLDVDENLIDIASDGNQDQLVVDSPQVNANSANTTQEASGSDIPTTSGLSLYLTPSVDTASTSLENLADSSSDLESELFDRSSPPPSYEDVTQGTSTNGSLNGLGLGYGTM